MGRVKTRLAADIGMVRATAFYRQTTARLIRRLGRDPRWQLVLAVTPDAPDTHHWPNAFPRLPQGRGDLGARMGRAFRVLPPGPALLIGSDVPDIAHAHIAAAFRALGRADFVFGPAADGGYWLVGTARRRPVPGLFRNVRWSGPHALADTLASIPPGRSVDFLLTLTDIDTGADYRAWRNGSRAEHLAGPHNTP
jgi:rSAM/selenodomain-associated transferase 1